MKILSLVLSTVLVCLLVQDARASVPLGATFPMKYEGGSLAFAQHDKLKTTVGDADLTFVQGKQTITIPLKSITEVSYGNDVHRRVGTAIGLAVVSLGIGALMLLAKTKKHYVGIAWLDQDKAGTSLEKGGVVFKVGKGEYRGFIAALEGKTGLKAV